MSRVVEVTIDCGGFPHRLQLEGEELRALDHVDERQQVFDALAGGSSCQEVVSSWTRFLHRFDAPGRRKISLGDLGALLPDEADPEAYEWTRHAVRMAALHVEAVRATGVGALVELPAEMRTALALTWVEHCLSTGAVPHRKRAYISQALAACWRSSAEAGVPRAGARRRLVRAVQGSFFPRPVSPEAKTPCPGTAEG